MKHWKTPAIAGAILITTIGIGLSGTAASAANGIEGSTTTILDFTVAGQVTVTVDTTNLSEVPAWGAAVVQAPNGALHRFGPKLYAAGEDWDYTTTLLGYSCDDLSLTSAAAFGFAEADDAEPSWTSGQVAYPDPRVTVLGCPVATTEPTPEPETPTPSPTVTPSEQAATPTPTPTTPTTPTTPLAESSPTATPAPLANSVATPTATTAAVSASAAASEDPSALAATGTSMWWVPFAAIAGLLALAVGGHAVAVSRRRDR